jgi:ubiquinone/menaquinone biosynthesis C-methylase UbiE
MIKKAQELYPDYTFIKSDITRTSLGDQTMSTALAIGVLEYLEEPDGFVQELSRILKPGGKLICSFTNQGNKSKKNLFILAKVVRRLRSFLQKGIDNNLNTLAPSNYKKDVRIRHTAYSREMVEHLFGNHFKIENQVYGDFVWNYYYTGIRLFDKFLSGYASKNMTLNKLLSNYATFFVVVMIKR